MTTQPRKQHWRPPTPLVANVGALLGVVLAAMSMALAVGLIYVDDAFATEPQHLDNIADQAPGLIDAYLDLDNYLTLGVLGFFALSGILIAFSLGVFRLAMSGWVGLLACGVAIATAARIYDRGVFHISFVVSTAMCGLLIISGASYVERWKLDHEDPTVLRTRWIDGGRRKREKDTLVVPHPNAVWDNVRGVYVLWDEENRQFLEYDVGSEKWCQLA